MAKAPIDVYKDWLGIQDTNRPLNYYQLLKLKPFEDNPAVIRDYYKKLNAHVRKYASGEYIAESQKLLNELAKGMLCLTDSTRKLEYDISLGRKIETSKARRSIEDILVANNVVPPERLKSVKNYADAVGIDLHEAVLQQKIAPPEVVMLAFAESIGLPFVCVEDVGIDDTIAQQINPNTARQHSFVPLMIDGNQLLLASPRPVNPDVEEELRMLFDMPVRSTICTPAEINAAIIKYYPRDAVQVAVTKTNQTTQKTANKTTASASKKTNESRQSNEPMTDEEKKNRLQTTIVAFNFSVMFVSFGLVYSGLLAKSSFQIPAIILADIVVGGIAALITWNKLTK
ncbi:MAG: hypothetical protein ACRCUY_01845 [Thermoguttaceae bacterium]